jgi:hypothetical protein
LKYSRHGEAKFTSKFGRPKSKLKKAGYKEIGPSKRSRKSNPCAALERF